MNARNGEGYCKGALNLRCNACCVRSGTEGRLSSVCRLCYIDSFWFIREESSSEMIGVPGQMYTNSAPCCILHYLFQ
jgi:hypothetical protein